MGRFKRPEDWREQLRPVYETDGKAIGRMIMRDRSKEPELWAMIGPTSLWPRRYLHAFATMYKQDNPKEYERWKKNRQNARKRAGRAAREGITAREDREKALRRQRGLG